ncbi:MAG: hypothetical protein ACRDP8_26780 [Actinopolymorphaceae bacterium]
MSTIPLQATPLDDTPLQQDAPFQQAAPFQQDIVDDAGAMREQRRRVVLRQARTRTAAKLARQSALMRTAVLLRSIGYHDGR